MSDKRQNNKLVLAFTEEGRSEAPKASQEGTESRTAKCATERPASHEQLMEEVCERENCWQAYKRVKANKGSPGIDGMKVGELSGYLKQHWPSIREQLLCGTYQPQPVRRVEIPKPDIFHDCLVLYRNPLNRRMRTRWCGRGERATAPPMPIFWLSTWFRFRASRRLRNARGLVSTAGLVCALRQLRPDVRLALCEARFSRAAGWWRPHGQWTSLHR